MASEDERSIRDAYSAFIARLQEARPVDADDELLVFADWLQSVGDPRGELIAVQHGLETASDELKPRLLRREQQLLGRASLRPDGLAAQLVWKRGFVYGVSLDAIDPGLQRGFEHPSLQLVRELDIDIASSWTPTVITEQLPALPPTLVALALRSGSSASIGTLAPLVANAPQLERLALDGPAELRGLAHPTLEELALHCWDARQPRVATHDDARTFIERISELVPARLPRLSRLDLHVVHGFDAALEALAATRLLDQLTALGIHGDDVTRASLSVIRAHGANLERLDVGWSPIAIADLRDLQSLSKEVIVKQRPLRELLETA